jgi:23S rRNA (adenine2503-C2)-methyltransferase
MAVPPQTRPAGPTPLGLTAREFVAAYPKVWGGSMAAYRRLFRESATSQPGLSVAIPPVVKELREESAEGTVIKFVQDVGEGRGGRLETESVLIPMVGTTGIPTYTLCVSSQVGCAMGCGFCETAQMGLIRSLTAPEIVAQWFAAAHAVGIRPKNMVFMGMGEPLDNLDAVIDAIAVLTDTNGPGVAMNKITVSTVGRVDGIRRLAQQVHTPGWHRLGIAVSVNAPNDEVRSALMPINRKWGMVELREALLEWPKYGGAKICAEYVLIPGVNDAREHARELAEWVRPLPACVNLIPYNPRLESPFERPEKDGVARFYHWLMEAGQYCRVRGTKGKDAMAACGQLGNRALRRGGARAAGTVPQPAP